MKEENPCFYTTHKRITTKSRTSTEFMGDFGHCINKEISCYFQQKRIISFLSETIKTEILQRRKYKSIDGYCTVPIISLQSASVHKKLVLQRKGYELLSLYFNRTEDPNAEQCPF
jgi:hypothetical protein